MSKPAPNLIKPRREEWDFSTVPEPELEFCLRYELAREIKDYLAYFDVSPESAQNRESAQEDNPGVIFPEEDYLYVGVMFPADRGAHFNEIPIEYPAFAWQQLPASFRKKVVWLAEPKIIGIETYVLSPLDNMVTVRLHERARGKDIHQVRINWKQSDTSLVDDFRVWLENNRPKEVPVEIHRGRQSVRDDLNALSAMRLRHHYVWQDAARLTQAALGKPMYSESFAWERAAERGRSLFMKFFPRAGEPKSGIRKSNLRGRPPGRKTEKVT